MEREIPAHVQKKLSVTWPLVSYLTDGRSSPGMPLRIQNRRSKRWDQAVCGGCELPASEGVQTVAGSTLGNGFTFRSKNASRMLPSSHRLAKNCLLTGVRFVAQIFEALGEKPTGKKCHGMEGLLMKSAVFS